MPKEALVEILKTPQGKELLTQMKGLKRQRKPRETLLLEITPMLLARLMPSKIQTFVK